MRNEMVVPQLLSVEGERSSAWAAVLSAAAVAGAMTLAAWVRVPLPVTPVPVTLQTLVVVLAGFLVGPRQAMAGMLLYLGLGFAGAPVLTQAIGPTLGYLLAFCATPWVVTRFRNTALGMVAGMGLIYAVGAGWLSLWAGMSPMAAIAAGVLPFLPGDAVKAVIAAKAAEKLR